MAWLRKESAAVAELAEKLESVTKSHIALAESHMALQAAHLELHTHVHAATVPAAKPAPSTITPAVANTPAGARPVRPVHQAGVNPVTKPAPEAK
jgi:hypothetical protein